MFLLDNKHLSLVVLSGRLRKDDMASPTVKNISFLSSRAVTSIQTTLTALHTITVMHIGRLNNS